MTKVVLITGGSSGIGKACAILFAKRGYQVAIAARCHENLSKTQQEISEIGVPVLTVPTDVSVAKAVEQLVQTVVTAWSQIDILIHAAGIIHPGTILDTDVATWDQILDINLKGTYLVNRYVLQQMIEQERGSIVNVASDAGLLGGRNLAAYCASKGGVVLLTRAMALDHARQGVRINALCPGPVETPMIADVPEAELRVWKQLLPIQRFATVQEVAEAAYFLAHAEYAVGSCLTLDGGNTAGGAI